MLLHLLILNLATGNLRICKNLQGVVTALRSKVFTALLSLSSATGFANTVVDTPKAATIPALEKKSANCTIISKVPKISEGQWPDEAKKLVSQLIENISENNSSSLKKLFHSRLKITEDFGEKLYYSLKSRYKGRWNFSLFRVWSINNPDEFKTPILCHEDEVKITPLFGYRNQIGVWLQLMSSTELGRIFVVIVPTKGTWKVGAIHLQQWTYMGKDYAVWANKGLKAENRDLVKAHIYYDIAQKMLFGGNLLEYPIKDKIIEQQNKALSKTKWLTMATETFNLNDPVYIGTLLTDSGPGILIRFRVQEEINNESFQKICVATGKKLISHNWLEHQSGGLRCDFILPKESINKPGVLGSQYFSFQDIKSSKYH
tara:strand:- start:790 stop:1908 length:1119 start_codon:yes stop_codon:yes gene_type:complete